MKPTRLSFELQFGGLGQTLIAVDRETQLSLVNHATSREQRLTQRLRLIVRLQLLSYRDAAGTSARSNARLSA